MESQISLNHLTSFVYQIVSRLLNETLQKTADAPSKYTKPPYFNEQYAVIANARYLMVYLGFDWRV